MTAQTGEKQSAQDSDPGEGRWHGKVWAQAFRRASQTKAWTLGFESLDADRLDAPALRIEGRLPARLRGTLYRNGPARHERGGQRYGHRYDGDGMVQAFVFGDDQIAHHGRFVQTEKYRQEQAAGRFLHTAFGTAIPGAEPMPQPLDKVNVANINALPFAGEVLALWEPGSAYRLDPRTLETIGMKTWSADLQSAPFSAHPKVEPDGSLWNFGVDPKDNVLYLYHVSAAGALVRTHSLKLDRLSPVHDFAVTQRHLVFLLPPLFFNLEELEQGASFAEACEWQPKFGMRALVIAKEDWSQRWYDLPLGFLFHTGNAWEDEAGVIRLDYMRAGDPYSLVAGWSVMRGEYRYAPGAEMTLLTLDPRSGKVEQTKISGEAEFPRVDPRLVGRRYRRVIAVGRSAGRDRSSFGFDEIRAIDVGTGAMETFNYGPQWLVEEHILVPDPADDKEGSGWIVGTALNLAAKSTIVSVFDAGSIAAGPIAQARLPYALPLGLHGNFRAR